MWKITIFSQNNTGKKLPHSLRLILCSLVWLLAAKTIKFLGYFFNDIFHFFLPWHKQPYKCFIYEIDSFEKRVKRDFCVFLIKTISKWRRIISIIFLIVSLLHCCCLACCVCVCFLNLDFVDIIIVLFNKQTFKVWKQMWIANTHGLSTQHSSAGEPIKMLLKCVYIMLKIQNELCRCCNSKTLLHLFVLSFAHTHTFRLFICKKKLVKRFFLSNWSVCQIKTNAFYMYTKNHMEKWN